jgi:hypothetical protein
MANKATYPRLGTGIPIDPAGSNTAYARSRITSEPWGTQQPYLDYKYKQAKQLYDIDSPGYYPGTTVAGFAPQQEAAMAAIENRARMGSPVNVAAQQSLQDTLSGSYLGENPYLQSMYDQAARNITGTVGAASSGAGRLGSGIHQGIMAQNLGDVATNLYGSAYDRERGRMQDALSYVPGISELDYSDYDRLAQVGQRVQDQAQEQITSDVERYDYGRGEPERKLGVYSDYIGQPISGAETTEQPIYSGTTGQSIAGMGNLLTGLSELDSGFLDKIFGLFKS